MEPAVCCLLTRIDDGDRWTWTGTTGTWTGSRIEIPEHGSVSDLFFFFWTTNKQRIDEDENNKINDRTMYKINEWSITNKRAQINK